MLAQIQRRAIACTVDSGQKTDDGRRLTPTQKTVAGSRPGQWEVVLKRSGDVRRKGEKSLVGGMIRFCLLVVLFVVSASAPADERTVTVDANQDLGPFGLLVGTNAGPMSMDYEEDYTHHYQDVGFSAVRTHDYYDPCDWYTIFPDWSRNPEDPASYDFASTDLVIAWIVASDLDVFFRLGPSWVSPTFPYHADPPGTIRDDEGNVIHVADEADFEKFANICRHIVMHYNEGWADGFYYDIQNWEIWNEPSLTEQFWTGTPLQFYQMFSIVAIVLKEFDPLLKVGGPGLAGGYNPAYLDGLIGYLAAEDIPLDFYSWHLYGRLGGEDPTCLPGHFKARAEHIRTTLDAFGYTNTVTICDEWNASLGPDNFADSGKGAAFYASALSYLQKANVKECYQYRGDDHALGLVHEDGTLKIAAWSLIAWRVLSDSTTQVATVGSDTISFTATASASLDGSEVWVLISNFPEDTAFVTLQLIGLPEQPESGWRLVQRLIDDDVLLEPVDSAYSSSADTVSFSFPMTSESVKLLQITASEPPSSSESLSPLNYPIHLHGIVPNPSISGAVITFDNPTDQTVHLAVFDMWGRRICDLLDRKLMAGAYSVTWNGRDGNGYAVAPGTYLLRSTGGEKNTTRRIVVFR